jgi:hypothetical protein
MTNVLSIEMFYNKSGEAFALERPDAPAITLTLIDVTALRNYANTARAPFSLIFTTRGADVLPQQLYELRHAELGSMWFFLVPIGKTGDTVSYQSIFN